MSSYLISKSLHPDLGNNPEAVRHRVSSKFIKTLAERWDAMSKEEREELTGETVAELTERRTTRKEGLRNLAVASFNDASCTLAVIEREVRASEAAAHSIA